MRSMPRSRARSWLMTNAPPCQRSSRAPTAARPSASRLLVGSSSRMKSGRFSSRAANAARVAWPPLSEIAGRSGARPARPTSASTASTRWGRVQSALSRSSSRGLAGLDPRQCRQRFAHLQQIGHVGSGRRSESLAQHAHAAAHADGPGAGRQFAEDQLEKGGLANPVAAHQADALAPEREGEIIEEGATVRRAVGEAVQGDKGRHDAP